MANKNRNLWVFLRIFLRRKYILTYPMQLGVLGRTSVEPITPGLSQRGRLLGAVAQWQLRLFFYLKFIKLTQTKFKRKLKLYGSNTWLDFGN